MFPDNMLSGQYAHYCGETCLFENDNLETLITQVVAWIRENPSRSNYHTSHVHYIGMVYHDANNVIRDKVSGEYAAVVQWDCPRYDTIRIMRKTGFYRQFEDNREFRIS